MYSKDRTYLLKQNEALFQATLSEFSAKPYDVASTNVIIKESSYNKGSFYYRFKAKEDIYYALIDYVFTKSIALFHKDGLKLSNQTDPEKIIDLLFRYTKSLYDEDPRFFELLVRIHHESKTLKQAILNNCIESFQLRTINRLREVLIHYDYKELLINNINSILYTHFDNFDALEDELSSIKQYLFKNQRIITENISSDTLYFSELPNYLNYVLIDELTYDLSYFDEYRIKRQLLNEEVTLEEIKNLFKIEVVTLDKVIDSGLLRNSRDLSDLLTIEALDFAHIEYSKLSYFQRIVLLTIYNTFLGKEYIIFDTLLENVNFSELIVLLNQILPKVSKVSKIIVLDKSIYPSLAKDYSTYKIVDQQFDAIHIQDYQWEGHLCFVEYIEDFQRKSLTMDITSEAFFNLIRYNQIIQIRSTSLLRFKDI